MEVKVSLRMLVRGASLLTPEFCDKNPKENYNKHKMLVSYTKKKEKFPKKVTELIVFNTRKQTVITHSINMYEEAYKFMLETPVAPYNQKTWKKLSINEKLKAHFDIIAYDFNALSYSYEILDD